MSDISRTTTAAPPQQAQEQQKQSVSQEQPQQASQQRFEQKLKEERGKKPSAKEKGKPQDLSEAIRQAKRGAQKPPAQTLAARDKGGDPKNSIRDNLKDNPFASSAKSSAEHLLDKRLKTPAEKADAILQGLQPQAVAAEHTIATAQQVSAPGQSSNALFDEFQAVADRVMHTSQNLQQGGSVRVQLSNSVLPGTSVTFSMVAGALQVTFSGNNKKSLDKVREHKEGLVSHVREQSGINIVVVTEGEQEQEQGQGHGQGQEGAL